MPEAVIAATILVIGHRGIRRDGREATIVQALPDILSACPGVPSMNASYLQPARPLRTLETAVSSRAARLGSNPLSVLVGVR
jgi:hypothetical protein